MLSAEEIIRALDLRPHPEGGFFRESFRAPLEITPPGKGPRSSSTAIYYLLVAEAFSTFHRVLGADEIWNHYLGDPVDLHTITPRGEHRVSRLGSDLQAGERPQVVVPADALQAATVVGSGFALCGCVVSPGFDFEDFVIPARTELLREFPQHREVIERLTR